MPPSYQRQRRVVVAGAERRHLQQAARQLASIFIGAISLAAVIALEIAVILYAMGELP